MYKILFNPKLISAEFLSAISNFREVSILFGSTSIVCKDTSKLLLPSIELNRLFILFVRSISSSKFKISLPLFSYSSAIRFNSSFLIEYSSNIFLIGDVLEFFISPSTSLKALMTLRFKYFLS